MLVVAILGYTLVDSIGLIGRLDNAAKSDNFKLNENHVDVYRYHVAQNQLYYQYMYIQYGMDSDIEMILSQFRNNGLYVCVRTFDPNIDERMIARKVHMKNMPLKVIRYASMDEVGAYEEKVDSGLVTCGSPKSLLQVISYCDKVLHTRKTNIALNILSVIIGAAVMTLLVLADSIGLMSSVFIILYQLLWIVPMLLSSKVFVR